jgi:site-specific DNA-methyltransferase (adenine-specific)
LAPENQGLSKSSRGIDNGKDLGLDRGCGLGPKHKAFEMSVTEEPRFIHGSCLNAARLCPDLVGEVTLAVTSPPYHNAISYESHAADPDANYRPRQGLDYSNEYLPLIAEAWDSMWVMLKPGGYLAVNVGTVLDGGHHYPLPMDVLAQLMHSPRGWSFVRNIIWHKVTAGVKRAGSVIQHQLPGYWYPNIMTEHIIVVRKRGPHLPLNRDVPKEWWEAVWDLAPVPPRSVPHPAPYPEDLPHRLIRMLTRTNDVIADPFNGAGATTKAAYDLKRRAVGFDLEEKYITYAKSRLSTSSAVRTMQLQIRPILEADFEPKKMRGRTRHGAGLSSRRRAP